MAGAVAAVVCALAASASWALAASATRGRARRIRAVVAGWPALAAVAEVLRAGDVPWAGPAADALVVAGTGAVILGLALAAGGRRPPARLTRPWAAPLAVAAVAGTAAAAASWLLDPRAHPPGGTAVLALARIAVAVAVLTVLARLAAGLRPPALPPRHGRRIAVATLAGLFLVAAAVAAAGHDETAALTTARLLAAAGFVVLAAVPWAGAPAQQGAAQAPKGQGAPWGPWGRLRAAGVVTVRLLPEVFTVLAAAGLAVRAVDGGLDPVTAAVLATLILAMLGVLAVARRAVADGLGSERRAQAQLVAVLDETGDAVLDIDAAGCVTRANPATARLLHRSADALCGRDLAELALPEQRRPLREALSAVQSRAGAAGSVDISLAPPATGSVRIRLRGVPGGAVAVLTDTSPATVLRAELEWLSRFDPATGLPNRAQVLEAIDAGLRRGDVVSVLCLDVVGFAAVNHRFGSAAGDALLAEVAGRVRAAIADPAGRADLADVPGRRLAGRLGGDEFVVVLRAAAGDGPERPAGAVSDQPDTSVVALVSRLREAMSPPFRVADRSVRLSLSIGVAGSRHPARLPPGNAAAPELLHRAELATLAAQRSRNGRAVRWQPTLAERAKRRVDLAIGVHRALDSGRLELAYQPIVRLSDGVIVSAEALIRVHPDDDAPEALAGLAGLVSPAELAEVADESGLSRALAEWVLRTAVQEGARWRDAGHDVRVGVNMSVRQLSWPGLVDVVRATLAAWSLPADRLIIEITEGQLIGEGEPAAAVVRRLRRAGVDLFIDDFGTGYASLSYLPRMPVRGIKIDRTLLAGLGRDERATTLAQAMIWTAHALGMSVVAEGLESPQMVRDVRELGADAGQGFALGAAVPGELLLPLLSRSPLDLTAGRAETPPPGRNGARTAPTGIGPASGSAASGSRTADRRVISDGETASGSD